jgi:hypothetical protein
MSKNSEKLSAALSMSIIEDIRRALIRLERTEHGIKAVSNNYETAKSPNDLMFAIWMLLDKIKHFDSSATQIHDDFVSAWHRYLNADVRDLGEAFGIVREPGWTQTTEKRKRKHGQDIECKVDKLRAEAKTVKEACRIVGEEYHTGWTTIRDDYYEYRNRMAPQRKFDEELMRQVGEQEKETSQRELEQAARRQRMSPEEIRMEVDMYRRHMLARQQYIDKIVKEC